MKVPKEHYVMTLQEVADELGISKQAVADIEKRALRKLKSHQIGRLLNIRAMAGDLRRSRESVMNRFSQVRTNEQAA